jgi:hypothetical protein
MRAVHEDDTRVPLAGGDDILNAIDNCFANPGTARLRRLIWVNQQLIDTAQALALCERIDFYLCEIDWFRKISQ